VVTDVAAGSEVGSGVGDAGAVRVEVEVGDGAADEGVWAAGAGGPKGEQPSPMRATPPRIQAATRNLLGTKDRIDDPLSADKRFIGNKQNIIDDDPCTCSKTIPHFCGRFIADSLF
jgi:hypothetical protein